jgi:hypothetical protein
LLATHPLLTTLSAQSARNFLELCVGHTTAQGTRLHYQGSLLHRVIEGFIVQGGDTSGPSGKVAAFLIFSDCFVTFLPLFSLLNVGFLAFSLILFSLTFCHFLHF